MGPQAAIKSLNIVTWNTNGIKIKLPEVMDSLNSLKADIALIQETHVGPECYQIFVTFEQKNWNVFFTVHSSSSKGVAILIKKDIQFEYICHDEDYNGGYIVLFCYLYGELFTFVNVYNHKADRTLLGRLKEYLIETAEGVLVIGGDFNTVLHPNLDRKPPTSRCSPFRYILKDFTVSLNLKDIWSCLHPIEEGFTRCQNESYSRIDMFFMPEDKINRVCSIKLLKQQNISDHYPLVLTLTVHVQTEKKIPNVATLLMDHKHNSDRRAGKISGAEILSVIRSLTDSEEARPDELQIYTYKRFQCPLTEILKIHFNNMLKDKCLYMTFSETYFSGYRHMFNVDYLIFTQILANRLSAFITPSFKGMTGRNSHIVFSLTFDSGEQQISWSFQKEAHENLKQTSSTPLLDFSILDCILPKVQSSDGLRHLQPGCPLTNTILNLVLKHLGDRVFDFRYKSEEVGHRRDEKHKCKDKEIMSMVSVCYERRVLLIHTKLKEHEVNNFKYQVKISGIKFHMNKYC